MANVEEPDDLFGDDEQENDANDTKLDLSALNGQLNGSAPMEDEDDAEVARTLNKINDPDFLSSLQDLGGDEKADDAVDYGDISDDDDLPEEELNTTGESDLAQMLQEANGLGSDAFDPFGEPLDTTMDDQFNDLFEEDNGDTDINALFDGTGVLETTDLPLSSGEGVTESDTVTQELLPSVPETDRPAFKPVKYVKELQKQPPTKAQLKELKDIELQQKLIDEARRKARRAEKIRRGEALDEEDEIPEEPETDWDLFERTFPRWNVEDTPRFVYLYPIAKRQYNAKKPPKIPKPINPQKVSLEIEPDQERLFNLTTDISRKRKFEGANQYGISIISKAEARSKLDGANFETEVLDENERIGNVTVQDLRILCEDWDSFDVETLVEQEPVGVVEKLDDDYQNRLHATKRSKLGDTEFSALPTFFDDFESFEDPELLTERISQRVFIDLNDPLLLINHQTQPSSKANKAMDEIRESGGSLKSAWGRRYNFSNDDEYDHLKENHSNKIRGTLANVALEHSLPAVKLQYPYYKVKLNAQESRSFHRPNFAFPITSIKFAQPARHKSKNMRGLNAQALYSKSSDLSMADNSTMLLVEYSEEYPIMLSNFGMGNKLVNYYRRKDEDDKTRPKQPLGETQVLLPQDKSPFSIFGNVEPGKIVPTFHNAMYRSPIYEHKTQPTDFLCIRSSVGDKASWYLRNMENLVLAGQQLPSMEVPGTHSRKVTDAAKRRLRMIAYRLYKKNSERRARDPWLSNDMIREHILGSDTAQNRGKMREFMTYDKAKSSWFPRPSDVVPNEETLRAWVKPEDICVLDSMQVGDQHLRDCGIDREGATNDDEADKEGQGIDEQLAPWRITKNFLAACQGKAMVQLRGEGDPTGRGEGFSFIKVSMKGGYQPEGESINDKMDQRASSHSYNVKQQEKAYNDHIKRIWGKQNDSLSSTLEHSDVEPDVDDEDEQVHRGDGSAPRSRVNTPSVRLSHRDDETSSQYSRFSSASQAGNHLKIVRQVAGKQPVVEIVTDPRVIKSYMRYRNDKDIENIQSRMADLKPTGDVEKDQKAMKVLYKELLRLEKNKGRRHVRDKAKGIITDFPATPGTPAGSAITKPTGTTRKCANCGQVGHIKTNKKACPMLNGTIKGGEQTGFSDAAFAGTPATPAGSSAMSPTQQSDFGFA